AMENSIDVIIALLKIQFKCSSSPHHLGKETFEVTMRNNGETNAYLR
ncbi:5158_t:CDS:1, partial [Funneliformis mosseae]